MLKSPGKKAFDACANKNIDYKESPQPDGDYLFGTTLACPGNGDKHETAVTHFDKNSALADLRSTVGKSACATCVFGNMKPLEVEQYKGEVARAAADAANAEIEALKAQEAHRKLLEEINGRVQAERTGITGEGVTPAINASSEATR